MAQTKGCIEALVAGPIIELQTGIKQLQTGLQIYLQESIEALEREKASPIVIEEGYIILRALFEIHDTTEPFTEKLLKWTRRCCSE